MALLAKMSVADINTNSVKQFLEGFEEAVGGLPETVRMSANSEGLFEHLIGQIQYYSTHPKLSFELLTFIRYIAACTFKNQACIEFNGSLLKRMGLSDKELSQILSAPTQAPLEASEQALLSFVADGLRDQTTASEEKMEELRSLGWQNSDIFDAVNHGFFIFAPGKMMDLFQMSE